MGRSRATATPRPGERAGLITAKLDLGYNVDGTLDSSFGVGGVVSGVPVTGLYAVGDRRSWDDGRILWGGIIDVFDPSFDIVSFCLSLRSGRDARYDLRRQRRRVDPRLLARSQRAGRACRRTRPARAGSGTWRRSTTGALRSWPDADGTFGCDVRRRRRHRRLGPRGRPSGLRNDLLLEPDGRIVAMTRATTRALCSTCSSRAISPRAIRSVVRRRRHFCRPTAAQPSTPFRASSAVRTAATWRAATAIRPACSSSGTRADGMLDPERRRKRRRRVTVITGGETTTDIALDAEGRVVTSAGDSDGLCCAPAGGRIARIPISATAACSDGAPRGVRGVTPDVAVHTNGRSSRRGRSIRTTSWSRGSPTATTKSARRRRVLAARRPRSSPRRRVCSSLRTSPDRQMEADPRPGLDLPTSPIRSRPTTTRSA